MKGIPRDEGEWQEINCKDCLHNPEDCYGWPDATRRRDGKVTRCLHYRPRESERCDGCAFWGKGIGKRLTCLHWKRSHLIGADSGQACCDKAPRLTPREARILEAVEGWFREHSQRNVRAGRYKYMDFLAALNELREDKE